MILPSPNHQGLDPKEGHTHKIAYTYWKSKHSSFEKKVQNLCPYKNKKMEVIHLQNQEIGMKDLSPMTKD